MRDFAKAFYHSPAWLACRSAYLHKVGGLCERCLEQGRYTAADTVHHIIHLSPENISDPSVSLADSNLMALCRDCHAAVHRKERRYKVDELGRVRCG